MFNEKYGQKSVLLSAALIYFSMLLSCGGGGGYGSDGSSYDGNTQTGGNTTGGDTTGGGTTGGSSVSFKLKTFYTGYVGVGGSIDGVKNPTLNVTKNDTVTIYIENGQNMTHNLTLEGFGKGTSYVYNTGDTASVTFTASTEGTSAYYCSLSGHRAAGMEGSIVVGASAKTMPEDFAEEKVLELSFGGAPSLAVIMPSAFEMDEEHGPDFDGFYFRKYAGGPSVGIYVGTSPAIFSYGLSTSLKEGALQDKKVTWLQWSDIGNENVTLIKREIIIPDLFRDTSVPDLQVHIFLSCYSEEDADTLQKYAETITVIP